MDLLINVHVDDLAKAIAFDDQAIGLRAERTPNARSHENWHSDEDIEFDSPPG